MNFHHIFFDLDGTLVDTSAGIISSLRYALEQMGTPPLSPEVERTFIGPLIQDSLRTHCGYDPDQIQRAQGYFRTQYQSAGIHQISPIPGIDQALTRLREHGLTLAVTSNKPQASCILRLSPEHPAIQAAIRKRM